MGAIVGGLLVLGLFAGPLAARIVLDRRLARADAVAADLRAVIRRRLEGDSMVSVLVEPAGVWSPGRVFLTAPSGYQSLIDSVWPTVRRRVPAGYELVVPAAAPVLRVPSAAAPPLSRAA